MAEITKIEHLNGRNYQSWKYNMKLVLMERGLWRFIEGTEVAPVSGTATAAAINAYRLRSDKVYSLIALSVEKNLQVHISTTTDPKTAWETLKNQFECISIAQVVRLNRRFYAATMDEGTDILEHLTYMTTLAEQLREMKEEISDKKFVTVVLGSLPPSYDNFISSLNTHKIEDLKWENVKAALIEEHLKRTEKDEKQTKFSRQNEALFSTKGNGLLKSKDPQFNSKNHGSNYRRNAQERASNVRCFKCGKLGHIVRNCPLNKNSSSHQSNSFAQERNETPKVEDVALTTSSHPKGSKLWFIDSGATKHMTYEKDLIKDYIEYSQPTEIFLGDDTAIMALGEGKVTLEFYDGSTVLTMGLYNVLYVPEISKNLLSVPAMTQKGAEVLFESDKCYVTKNGVTMNIGHLISNNLYVINTEPHCANVASGKASMELWHCRYGHLNYKYVSELKKKHMVDGMSYPKDVTDQHCEACAKAKMHRYPFQKQVLTRQVVLYSWCIVTYVDP